MVVYSTLSLTLIIAGWVTGFVNGYSFVGNNPISFVDPDGNAIGLAAIVDIAWKLYGMYNIATTGANMMAYLSNDNVSTKDKFGALFKAFGEAAIGHYIGKATMNYGIGLKTASNMVFHGEPITRGDLINYGFALTRYSAAELDAYFSRNEISEIDEGGPMMACAECDNYMHEGSYYNPYVIDGVTVRGIRTECHLASKEITLLIEEIILAYGDKATEILRNDDFSNLSVYRGDFGYTYFQWSEGRSLIGIDRDRFNEAGKEMMAWTGPTGGIRKVGTRVAELTYQTRWFRKNIYSLIEADGIRNSGRGFSMFRGALKFMRHNPSAGHNLPHLQVKAFGKTFRHIIGRPIWQWTTKRF